MPRRIGLVAAARDGVTQAWLLFSVPGARGDGPAHPAPGRRVPAAGPAGIRGDDRGTGRVRPAGRPAGGGSRVPGRVHDRVRDLGRPARAAGRRPADDDRDGRQRRADRGLCGHPGDRRRRHRLRQPAQRDPHRRGLRGGRRRRDPHRGPGRPEEVRAHGRQDGHPRRGDGGQDQGRDRGPRRHRFRDHRQDRREGRRGFRAITGTCRALSAGGRGRPVHRGTDQRGGGRGGGACLPRGAAAVQLGRGRQDPAGEPGPAAEISRAGTPAAALGDLPAFGEFADFIGLPEVRAAEQRYTAADG